MPKNKIGKNANGKLTYSVINDGKQRKLVQRNGESRAAFIERCNDLDDTNISASSMTFESAYKNWMEDHVAEYCSQAFYDQADTLYRNHIKESFSFKAMSDIRPSDVTRLIKYVKGKGLSISTQKHIRKVVSGVFNYAIEQNDWSGMSSPTGNVHIKEKKQIVTDEDGDESLEDDGVKFVSTEEQGRLLDAAERQGCHYALAFEFYPLTGLRRGELPGLNNDDIRDGQIYVVRSQTRYGLSTPKTKSGVRTIPLTEESIDVLWRQKQFLESKGIKSNYIFPDTNGKRTSAIAIQSAFRRTLRQTAEHEWLKAGNGQKKKGKILVAPVDFSIQDYRHTFATIASRYLDPANLQQVMGHKSIQTTMRYYVGKTREHDIITKRQMARIDFHGISK